MRNGILSPLHQTNYELVSQHCVAASAAAFFIKSILFMSTRKELTPGEKFLEEADLLRIKTKDMSIHD